MTSTQPEDVATELDLVRADGIRQYNAAARLLNKAEETRDHARRRDLMERCQYHTELAKAAALLTR